MLNPTVLRAFAGEMQKLAGVEMGLVGYHREPEHPEKARLAEKWWEENPGPASSAFKTQVPLKGILNRLRGKTEEHFNKESWEKAWRAHSDAAPEAAKFDQFDYRQASRIRTPHSHYGGNKLIAHTLGSVVPDKLTSDFAYQEKDIDVRLSREQIREILKLHAEVAARDPNNSEEVRKHHEGFQAHGRALLADPKLKFARLEWY
jgi:hypothetical protein